MQTRQHPLPTELIPKHTWLVIKHHSRHVRALTTQDSEVVDGRHIVKIMGYGLKNKVVPVSSIVSRFSTLN